MYHNTLIIWDVDFLQKLSLTLSFLECFINLIVTIKKNNSMQICFHNDELAIYFIMVYELDRS